MNLIRRLRNLWKLSGVDPTIERTYELGSENGNAKALKPILRMAQIIKKTTPVQDFLNEKKL